MNENDGGVIIIDEINERPRIQRADSHVGTEIEGAFFSWSNAILFSRHIPNFFLYNSLPTYLD